MSNANTPTPESKKPEKGGIGDWVKILSGAFFGAIFGAAGTWVVSLLLAEKPHLTVTTTETVRFQGEGNKIGIANITIQSDGNKEAKSIECNIPNVIPTEVKVTPNYLNSKLEVSGSAGGENCRITIPSLNPRESVSISVLSTRGEMPDKLEPSVRGEGVVGQPPAPPGLGWGWLWFVLVGLVCFALGAFVCWGVINAIQQGVKDAVYELEVNPAFDEKRKAVRKILDDMKAEKEVRKPPPK